MITNALRETVQSERIWYRVNSVSRIRDIDGNYHEEAKRTYFRSQPVAIFEAKSEANRTGFDVTVQEVVCFPFFGANLRGCMPEGAVDEGLSVVIWRASEVKTDGK